MIKSKSLLAAVALMAALWGDIGAAENRGERYEFDIPAQKLGDALQALAFASQYKLLYSSKLVDGRESAGLKGRYTAEEAVEKLLAGTGLKFQVTGDSVVVIQGAGAAGVKSSSLVAEGSGARLAEGEGNVANSDAGTGAQGSSDNVKGSAKAEGESKEELKELDIKGIPEILVTGNKGKGTMNVDVVRSEDDIQPYIILNSKLIERSGAVNMEDFLRQQLTMNTVVSTNAQNFGVSTGTTSSINLRGLGANETLVLINGRRLAGVSLSGFTNQPDINGIPLSAVERVEILPSSASAIYGGAALGGVVNVVLKKNYDGGEIAYSYSDPTSGHSPIRNINGSYGDSLGGGGTQVMLSGHYSEADPVLLGDRQDLFGRAVSEILANSPSYFFNAARPFFGASPNIAGVGGARLVLDDGRPLNSSTTNVPVGTAPGSDLGAALLANAGRYNLDLSRGTGVYTLGSPFGSVSRTESAFLTVRQDLGARFQLFTEVSVSGNDGRATSNPFSAQVWTVPSASPANPFGQNVRVSFPSSLSEPFRTQSTTRAGTLGLVARLDRDWSSEIDYTWSKNSFKRSAFTADTVAFNAALRSGAINPFVDTLANPLNLEPYVVAGNYSGATTLNDLTLRASGPLGEFPAGSPILTVGLGHRKEGSDDARDTAVRPLNPANNLDEIFFGQSQSTASLYLETLVPLVSAKNAVPWVEAVDLQVAVRSEKYTTSNGTAFVFLSPESLQSLNPPQGAHTTTRYTSTNPTVGLRFQPIAALTLRVSYATAFLPPTAVQLLQNPSSVCGGAPCAEIADPQNGQTYLIDYTSGGNPNLEPQEAKSWNFGVVVEPPEGLLRGFRFNVEHYRINQPNYITTPTQQQLVSDPLFSDHVTRDPATDLVTIVAVSPVNAMNYRTSGYDIKIDYRKETAYGLLSARVAGTYVTHDQRQYTVGSALLEFAGYSNDGGENKLKSNLALGWERGPASLVWTTSYYSSYKQIGAPGSPFLTQYGEDPTYVNAQGGFKIPSQMYHDLYFCYAFREGAQSGFLAGALSNVTLQAGIKNVTDKRPPMDAAFYPYFYSPYGDPRLREFRLAVKKGF